MGALVSILPGWLTRTTRQANHAPSPSELGMRVGAGFTQTGVLAKGRAEGSAGEIEDKWTN